MWIDPSMIVLSSCPNINVALAAARDWFQSLPYRYLLIIICPILITLHLKIIKSWGHLLFVQLIYYHRRRELAYVLAHFRHIVYKYKYNKTTSRGPSTDPWATPLRTSFHFDWNPSTTTRCFLRFFILFKKYIKK